MEFDSPVNRLLADAVVIGPASRYGREKLRGALWFMAAHAKGNILNLPAEFADIPEFTVLAADEFGDRFVIAISKRTLPAEAIAAAQKRQANREVRTQGCSNPNCTASNPGCANGKKDK